MQDSKVVYFFLTCTTIAAYKIRIRQGASSNLMHAQVNERLGLE